jgi:hypothetical protein
MPWHKFPCMDHVSHSTKLFHGRANNIMWQRQKTEDSPHSLSILQYFICFFIAPFCCDVMVIKLMMWWPWPFEALEISVFKVWLIFHIQIQSPIMWYFFLFYVLCYFMWYTLMLLKWVQKQNAISRQEWFDGTDQGILHII